MLQCGNHREPKEAPTVNMAISRFLSNLPNQRQPEELVAGYPNQLREPKPSQLRF